MRLRSRLLLRLRLRLRRLGVLASLDSCQEAVAFRLPHLGCRRESRQLVLVNQQQVLREGGASTHFQKLLRQTTMPVDASDHRRIDVLAVGLPVFHGQPLFCDATFRSPLSGSGVPRFRSDTVDGATLHQAEKDKIARYRDIEGTGTGKLVILGGEVGGRWNNAALQLVRALAAHKASEAPELLRGRARQAWT